MNMAIRRLLAFLAFLSLGQMVIADGFTNPPPTDSVIDNPVYKVGDKVKITWTTDEESTSLTMWQSDTGEWFTLQGQSEAQEYNWIVSYQGIDPKNGTSFSLWLFKSGESSPLFSSHSFNITDPDASTTSATTSEATTRTQSHTRSLNTATKATSKPTASATEEPESSSSSGLSSGATAGVAIGCVAGAIVLAGVGFMFWRRRRANSGVPPTTGAATDIPKHGYYAPVEAPSDNGIAPGPYEMGDTTNRQYAHELPSNEYGGVGGHRT
ncbi:hypothetical protein FSARC_4021 [Fusarium sarcochroum]|uniref:Mid2 domain-containing protein n=1 Tax=Fusarium sarcochroum TaxID=1208366 RepID=A0A8H4U2K9_9HYPO|nr:hypothetical protein FSARC_4021 [Fusarium sarcochroum]